MKKITVLFIALMGLFVSVNAQEKGDVYVGGNLGFSVSSAGSNGYMNSSTRFSIAPEFGYFIVDNLKIGAELSYSVGGGHTMTISPNVSYYLRIVDNLYYTPQFSIGGGFTSHSHNTNGVFSLSMSFLSLEFQPKENWGISMDLVNLSYNLENSYNHVGFNFLSSPSVGVRYYF